MKINTSFSATEESFPEQSNWIGNLLSPLSSCFSTVLLALNGNLSIGDNLIGVVTNSTFTTASNYSTGSFTPIRIFWTPGNRRLPQTVLVGRVSVPSSQASPLAAVTAHSWTYDPQSQAVVINYVAGLANSGTYTVTFEIK